MTGMEHRKIIYQGGAGEIVEKKSRFIATVAPVRTEQEALDFIAARKKEYWDARHNCFAYIIGSHQETMRCSDDGEPAQTAGRPMLDVLLGENLYNIVVVVTRYFGGVLLGTGGLVRAYQGAVKAGLDACVLLEQCQGRMLQIATDYNGYGKVSFALQERQVPVMSSDFGAEVVLQVVVEDSLREILAREIADKTSGDAILTWGDEVSYGVHNGEVLLFPT